MIDPSKEELVPLAQSPGLFPGKPPTLRSVKNYVSVGCRGAVLESIFVGGRRYVTRESVARFIARLNDRTPTRPTAA